MGPSAGHDHPNLSDDLHTTPPLHPRSTQDHDLGEASHMHNQLQDTTKELTMRCLPSAIVSSGSRQSPLSAVTSWYGGHGTHTEMFEGILFAVERAINDLVVIPSPSYVPYCFFLPNSLLSTPFDLPCSLLYAAAFFLSAFCDEWSIFRILRFQAIHAFSYSSNVLKCSRCGWSSGPRATNPGSKYSRSRRSTESKSSRASR
ncbi:uncharacterized protein C8Q71DRAFT_792801 [Rhodofomes roseus]|uniref:Uncharacterized protein n=1 Tax=Rhodofomes roseus TaxID=34475 RepID=A0ABQ8JXR2_9APHY|nr:uncharacterized protein C8Q71DRAFT_792801 [Rhodofomes roseus]KAH9828704.1 hypothetical protein C8Q71DRAFT_792801 [Rhodofomes roseus]